MTGAGAEWPTPTVRAAVWRGLRRRCPRCGRDRLYERWFSLRACCGSCALRFERDPGDTWGFWVLFDRIFVLVPIVVLYFGFAPSARWAQVLFFILLIGALVATMPHRQGIAVALDYLARTKQGQV